MEATLVAIEQACRDFQNPATRPAAEQVLLQFRQSLQPLPACRYILEHSTLLEAQFHAAGTLRESMMKQWALLQPEDVRELRSYILRLVLKSANNATFAVVRSALLAALAVLLKRSWQSEPQELRMAFFQEVQTTVSAVGTASAQRTGMEFLEGLVSEFALATASSLGLPWQYHEQCHMDLESHFLRSFFTHAGTLAKQAVASGAAERGEDAGTCAACLSLIVTILSWEFQTGFGASPLSTYNTRRSTDSLQVRLPPSWLELVMAEENIGWLLALLPRLQGRPAASSTLARKARELMVLLCMISSDSFPRSPQGTPYREAHLEMSLRGLMLWMHPPAMALQRAANEDEDELLDACRALSSLSMTHRAAMLVRVGGSHVLETVDKLTCSCMAAGGVTDAAKGTWVGTCTELLLEAWLSLLQPQGSSLAGSRIPPVAVEAATRVFLAFMDASLQDFAVGAHEDAQDDDEEEAAEVAREAWLSHAAALARCNPAATFPVLKDHIMQRKQLLYTLASQGADPSECLEQLCWLLAMAAACLADHCPGETALVPETVLAAINSGQVSVVEGLSHALLEMCALVLQEGAVNVLSPRLMEAAVTALARWINTYLFSEDEDFPEPLMTLFGASGAGQSILAMAVQVATTCLASYPGEGELHHQVCEVLLPSLVGSPPLCRQLVCMDSWQALTNAFASRQPMLTQQLHQKMHRALAFNLCRAASGFSTPEEVQGYTTHVMVNVAQEVVGLTQHQDFKERAMRADVTQQICCLLESLRGATRSATLSTHTPLFAIFSSVLPALLILHRACSANPLVVGLLLKLAADMVDTEVAYLKDCEIIFFLDWVYQLVQQYTATAIQNFTSRMASSQLQQDQREEAARELRALMCLLTNLLQRDLVDLSHKIQGHDPTSPGKANGHAPQHVGNGAAHRPVDVAQVVLQGLNCILPLMSEDLMKYPKLGTAYFTLLSYLADTYPQHVAGLPPDQFSCLMRGVQFGVTSDDLSAAHLSLEALAGLGKWHLKQAKAGLPGLQACHAAGGKSVAAYFMGVVLQRLLLADSPAELVDSAADALLPLLLAQPQAFEQLATDIVLTQSEVKAQQAVHTAMSDMLHSSGLSVELTRQNKVKFRGNLANMVASVRGLLLTR